jgi:hypothetical protein
MMHREMTTGRKPVRITVMQITACSMIGLLGCGSSPARDVAGANKAEQRRHAQVAGFPTGPRPQFALSHWPWEGMRTSIEVFDEGDAKVLRVYRSIEPQFLATWKLRLTGSDAASVDEIVKGLVASAGTVQSCPRPEGRNGALWIMRAFAAKTDCVGDFGVKGVAECARFEGLAKKLMEAGKLQCGLSGCLRPEERETHKFTCSLGLEGDPCREPSYEQGAIPRQMLEDLRD